MQFTNKVSVRYPKVAPKQLTKVYVDVQFLNLTTLVGVWETTK